MTTPSKLNEFNHAEDPARRLLERLGWTCVPRETLAAERGDEREVLLKGRLKAALDAAQRMDDRGASVPRHLRPRTHRRHRHGPQPGGPRVPHLRDALDRGRTAGKRFPHRPLLRLRTPGWRPQRVRRHNPVSGSPWQRAGRARGRRSAWSSPTWSCSSTASH